jgi:hypothetical protein
MFLESQAVAWILVVGHALNPVLNKVSAASVYRLGIAASELGKEIRSHNFGKGFHRHTGPGSQKG